MEKHAEKERVIGNILEFMDRSNLAAKEIPIFLEAKNYLVELSNVRPRKSRAKKVKDKPTDQK